MPVTRIPTDVSIEGSLSVSGSLGLTAGSVSDATVAASAAIDADKLEHLYKPGTNFDLAIAGTPATREEIVFVASGAATVRAFHCLLNVTGTSTNIDFDLKKNGTTILSAVVNIANTDADGLVKDGTISGGTLMADDIISISMAVTTSTGAQGPMAWLELTEGAN